MGQEKYLILILLQLNDLKEKLFFYSTNQLFRDKNRLQKYN